MGCGFSKISILDHFCNYGIDNNNNDETNDSDDELEDYIKYYEFIS